MPNMSLVHLPQLYIVSPTGKKARHPWCRDSGVSKGHLLRLWLKPFRILIFLDFSPSAIPVTLPSPVRHSSATLILQRTCLLPLFRETSVIDSYAPFSLTLVLLLLIHAASTAGRSCTAPPPIHYRKTASKGTLAVFQFGLSIMHYTVANLNLFRWISGEVKSYFLGAKLWNSFHFFRKCRWTIRKYRLCLFTPESSFSDAHKRVFRDKLSAAILSNKNIRIFLFLQAQKEYSYIFSWLPQSLFLIEAP